MNEYVENIPRPDPSKLTTEQFDRGVEMLRREDASQKEFILGELRRITEVSQERFNAIQSRFDQGAARLEDTFRASKLLIDTSASATALAAEKSEKSFANQIEALDKQMDTFAQTQAKEVYSLKERIVGNEARDKGGIDTTARLMSIAMFIVTLIGLYYTLSHH